MHIYYLFYEIFSIRFKQATRLTAPSVPYTVTLKMHPAHFLKKERGKVIQSERLIKAIM